MQLTLFSEIRLTTDLPNYNLSKNCTEINQKFDSKTFLQQTGCLWYSIRVEINYIIKCLITPLFS